MTMYDIIKKKRDGAALSKQEIEFFVQGYAKGEIPDYEASALIMAMFIRKLTGDEMVDLTLAMAHSGEILDLSCIGGIVADKHSTGGVGDTTTLVLAPMVAAAGVPMAKMSGRGLGFTGGTIDKLECFDGFNTAITTEQFLQNVKDIGLAIMRQTENITPADKKMYALRDVTATVDDVALIASSIMSKKIATGADVIVLDVKVGSGAFMKDEAQARQLAQTMAEIGRGAGKKVDAVITSMEQPLGYAVGNTLEVIEAIDTLRGNGPQDLLEVCMTLGARILTLAGRADNDAHAKEVLSETLESGRALDKLKQLVAAQGGDSSFIDNLSKFARARIIEDVCAKQDGLICAINAEAIGLAAMRLGAERETKESEIDRSAGIVLRKKVGDFARQSEPIAVIHTNDEGRVEEVRAMILEAYKS